MSARFYQNLLNGLPQLVVIYGTSLSEAGAWPKQMQRVIQTRHPGLFTMVNAARSGENSRWGVEHLEESVLALHPDAIFIEFTMNDAATRFDLSLEESRQNHNQMLERIADTLPHCETILQIMNPAAQKPAANLSLRRQQAEYQQIYRELARERGLLLMDHSPAWNAILAAGEDEFIKYVPDGVHPNDEAYERLVTPVILSALGVT